MEILLIIGLFIVMGLVVYALARGLHAFADMKPDDVDENGIPRSLSRQNQMMFARVKWQAVAIVIVMLLLVVGGAVAS